jgi:hypothetical protein
MAARYRKGLELQALGRDLARLERIRRTAETGATIKCVMLRLIACRRRCRVIRACAVDTQDGEVESEGYERPAQLERHPDIRAWYLIPRPRQTPFETRYAVRCVTP